MRILATIIVVMSASIALHAQLPTITDTAKVKIISGDVSWMARMDAVKTYINAGITDNNGIYSGDGIIPNGTDAKLTTLGTFNINYSDNGAAIQINDDLGAVTLIDQSLNSTVSVEPDQAGITSNGSILALNNQGVYITADILDVTGVTTFLGLPSGGGGGGNYQTIEDDGVAVTQRPAANFTSTSDVTFTITDDVVNSESDITADIPDGSVSYAEIQNVSNTNRLLGRATAGSGSVEEITVGGDLVQSGSNFTVNADAITYAKIQNVTANSVLARVATTDGDVSSVALSASTLLGRGSTGNISAINAGGALTMSGTLLTTRISSQPATNNTASGIEIQFTANEAQAVGDVVYIADDGEAQLADADTIATSRVIAICSGSVSAGSTGTYITHGVVRNDSWNWTVGRYVFLTTTGTTGNTLSQSAPIGTNRCVVNIGIATHPDRIFFNPTQTIIELE
jgi:hypothetical protein